MTEWLTTTSRGLSTSLDVALGLRDRPMLAVLAGIVALGLAGRLQVGRPEASPWPITGLALGTVGVLAWVLGSLAGWGWGLSITGPSRSLVESTVLGMPGAAGFGTALVVGIPLGSWLSARARGRVGWRTPGRGELRRRFTGGLLMGIGGTIAAGCNIGNALTGLSVLAVNSLIATAAIVGGATVAVAWPGIHRRLLGLFLTRGQR
jgi:hypothetical protein